MAAPSKFSFLQHCKNATFAGHKHFSTTPCALKKVRKPPKHIMWHKIVSNYELNRIETGKSRTGTEYGVLTDKSDWAFPDGRPGYSNSGQIRRRKEQYDIARDICNIHGELLEIKAECVKLAAANSEGGKSYSYLLHDKPDDERFS